MTSKDLPETMGALDRWLDLERFDAVREHEAILKRLKDREEPEKTPVIRKDQGLPEHSLK